MNKEELAAEAQRAVEELIEVSGCRAGQVLVVGKSMGCTLLFSAASI